jgi:hypothetical protein
MRFATTLLLLLLLAFATPAFAQDPIPDTTSAWRYFPLEIGNVWEYRCLDNFCDDERRHSVTGDTLVSGTRYFRYDIEIFEPDGPLLEVATLFLRFDTLSATIQGLGEGFGFGCALDADFGTVVTCGDFPDEYETYGGSRTITLSDDTFESTLKGYQCCFGDVDEHYVADIG